MKKKTKKPKPVTAWAWLIDVNELCYWAAPTKEMLKDGGKPSPEAKPIRVKLVPL